MKSGRFHALTLLALLLPASEGILLTQLGLAAGSLAYGAVLGGLGGVMLLKMVALKAGALGARQAWRTFAPTDTASPTGFATTFFQDGVQSLVNGDQNSGSSYNSYTTSDPDSYTSYSSGWQDRKAVDSNTHKYARRRPQDNRVTSPQLENYFQMVAALDVNQCARRLVCELEAKDPRDLIQDEEEILSLFRDQSPPSANEVKNSVQAQFKMAAFAGRVGKLAVCKILFERNCPKSGEQIMSSLRQME